jgi:hypothetical protein
MRLIGYFLLALCLGTLPFLYDTGMRIILAVCLILGVAALPYGRRVARGGRPWF